MIRDALVQFLLLISALCQRQLLGTVKRKRRITSQNKTQLGMRSAKYFIIALTYVRVKVSETEQPSVL